jgi:hypothetical protein
MVAQGWVSRRGGAVPGAFRLVLRVAAPSRHDWPRRRSVQIAHVAPQLAHVGTEGGTWTCRPPELFCYSRPAPAHSCAWARLAMSGGFWMRLVLPDWAFGGVLLGSLPRPDRGGASKCGRRHHLGPKRRKARRASTAKGRYVHDRVWSAICSPQRISPSLAQTWGTAV